MNYFSRQREDGKWDVLEGTPDEPGRIVTTLDTMEEAAAYIDEQATVFNDLFNRITDIELNDIDLPAEDVLAAAEEDNVPYKLASKDGKTCVVKKSDGSIVKCHDDREKAAAHMRALMVNYADASVQAAIAELGAADAIDEAIAETVTASAGTSTTSANLFISNPAGWKVTALDVNGVPLVAHAEPPAPPAEFFTDPKLTKLERYVTVTDDGRIFGHYAGPEDCHIGYMDACVPAPLTADSLTHWTVGTVKTADGSVVPTGPLALRYGHAETAGVSVKDAKAHYDDPDSGIADIVVGLDDHGGWFSGAIRPGVSPADVRKVLASGVSGDWRVIDGQLRLIGICSVNRPGFTKVQIAASADGQIEALVAAGGPPLPHPDLCDCKDMTSDIIDELDNLQRIVADAGLEDVIIEKLASRIPAEPSDPDLDSLYERIKQ